MSKSQKNLNEIASKGRELSKATENDLNELLRALKKLQFIINKFNKDTDPINVLIEACNDVITPTQSLIANNADVLDILDDLSALIGKKVRLEEESASDKKEVNKKA
jgi:ABC-type transporter Mla subunit MlaD